MKRRHVLAAIFAATVTSGAAAQQAPAPQRYAVLSAVGDQMTVVRARTQTGSRLDRNDQEAAALPDRALDRLVLKHVDGALRRSVPSAWRSRAAACSTCSGRPCLGTAPRTRWRVPLRMSCRRVGLTGCCS
jgi:hypothetical protein